LYLESFAEESGEEEEEEEKVEGAEEKFHGDAPAHGISISNGTYEALHTFSSPPPSLASYPAPILGGCTANEACRVTRCLCV